MVVSQCQAMKMPFWQRTYSDRAGMSGKPYAATTISPISLPIIPSIIISSIILLLSQLLTIKIA